MNNDSRTFNSARNITMSVIQKIVSMLLTFFGRQVFLRILTIEYLGINGLFTDIFTMLSLADLGLVTAMAYSFYKPLAIKDEEKLAALIGFYRKVYNIIAVFVAAAGLALTPFLRHIINLEGDIPHIEIYYLVALGNTVISYLFVYKSTIIMADQKHSIITRYVVLTSILGMILQIMVLVTLRSYFVYCLVTVFCTLLNNLIISHKAAKMYPFIKKKVQLIAADKREIFYNIKSMFIYKLSSVVFNGTDSIFISSIISTAIVGKYANYRLAVTNLSMISFIIFNSLSPSVGNLIAKEPHEKRMKVFRVMQTINYWIGGVFVFGLFFLLDDFVVLWVGREYIFSLSTKLAILVSFHLSMTLYPIVTFREATGIYQKTQFTMIAAAVLRITLSIIMGMYWGLVGIILSSTIAKLLTYVWYEPKILFRDFLGGSAFSYLFGQLTNLAILVGCIAIAYFCFPQSESSSWLDWIIKGIIYTLVINVVYFLRYFKTPEFLVIKEKIKVLVKR